MNSASRLFATAALVLGQWCPNAEAWDGHGGHGGAATVGEGYAVERTAGSMPVQGADAAVSTRGGHLALPFAAPIGDEELDALRGGFELPSGLLMSFGIERLVYVNGELSSTTRLTVADLGRLVGGGAEFAQDLPVGSTLALIQNGPSNVFAADFVASGGLATVIQNSLDHQRIQVVTTLDAQVSNLDMLRAQRLGDSLRDALNLR